MILKQSHRLVYRQKSKKPRNETIFDTRKHKCFHSGNRNASVGIALDWTSEAGTERQTVTEPHQHSATCGCRKPGWFSMLSLCRILPLQQFGNSILPTPLVVVLRLFMPASSLALSCRNSNRHVIPGQDPEMRAVAVGARLSSSYLRPRRLRKEHELGSSSRNGKSDMFARLDWRVSVEEFLQEVSGSSMEAAQKLKVVSITWVKALATHMSHEFVQFVVEDIETGVRRRLIADRQETGDWITITSSPEGPLEMSDLFTGLASRVVSPTGQTSPYRDRHTLPLPLVSVMYDSVELAPSLTDIAKLLSNISQRCKEYNPLREHCWWFSESAVVEASKLPSARLEEWQWSRWRYSFVVVNRYIRRKRLEAAAHEFEQNCLEEYKY